MSHPEIPLPLNPSLPPRRICVVGCSGSIGRSAAEVIAAHPEAFQVESLIARRSVEELVRQARLLSPRTVAVADLDVVEDLRRGLEMMPQRERPAIVAGNEAIIALVQAPEVDTVLAAAVGFEGLPSTLAAVEAGKRVALANKESLVAAGALMSAAAHRGGGVVIPVDSEHSAIFQALQGVKAEELEKLILTASGGPFLRRDPSTWRSITPQEAVKHPRWAMGAKISVDSATLMNKAQELIEAFWLFRVPSATISVLVHPQSIVHSLIECRDGSLLAQLSWPDMKGPIAYALRYPYPRLAGVMRGLDLGQIGSLTFEPLDERRFPAVALARRALELGGKAPAVFTLANEYAVQLFLKGELYFDEIVPVVGEMLERIPPGEYGSLEDLYSLRTEVESLVQLNAHKVTNV